MTDRFDSDWINKEKVKYFDLLEFVSRIKLSENVLEHSEYTATNFEEYLKTLVKFCNGDDYTIIYYLLDLADKELKQSARLESSSPAYNDLVNRDLFFDKLSISHERIKNIHKFVCEKGNINIDNPGEYRKIPVDVGADYDYGHQVYWYAPEVADIKPFMNSFITFYKTSSVKELYNNPFLKSALAHLLFVRIHPFEDGNGRTARVIQSIAFTNVINRIYGTNLKLSPLNISQNIALNKYTYADILNKIHFNLDYDNEEMLNKWFNFILNMYDEQLFYQLGQIPKYEKTFRHIQEMKDNEDVISGSVKKFKLQSLKKIGNTSY